MLVFEINCEIYFLSFTGISVFYKRILGLFICRYYCLKCLANEYHQAGVYNCKWRFIASFSEKKWIKYYLKYY